MDIQIYIHTNESNVTNTILLQSRSYVAFICNMEMSSKYIVDTKINKSDINNNTLKNLFTQFTRQLTYKERVIY